MTEDNIVVVVGDDADDQVCVLDGLNSGGGPTDDPTVSDYGVRLITENGACSGGPVPTADPKCFQDAGATYCGGNSVQLVYVALGGGDDEIVGGGLSFSQLGGLYADFGDGNDSTSGDWNGLPLTLNGEDGDDDLFGGTFDDTLNGGAGNDDMLGATGNDTLHGDAGNDTVNGGGEDDEVYGDSGNDTVIGSADSDIVDGGPGTDEAIGDGGTFTEGNDRINVDDGERDTVTCGGGGGDVVTADQLDDIAPFECEAVTRSGTPSTPSGTGSSGSPSGTGSPSTPSGAFTIGRVVSSKRTGAVTISLDVPGPGTLALVATAKVPASLLSRRRRITVARRTATASAAGQVRVTLKPSSAAKRVLRRKRTLRASLAIAYTPTGGAKNTVKRTVTFKRARRR